MTDRVRHLTIVLDRDYRDDDVEHLVAAIRLLRGVSEVVPGVVDGGRQMARMVAKTELRREIMDAFDKVLMP